MSWRDNSGSGTNGTQDGSGGSMSGGGSVSGTGGGGFGGMRGQTTGDRGGYTFRGVPGKRSIGNWNTGGPVVGTGSVMGGIRPANVSLPRAMPQPTGFNIPQPVVPPMPVTPITSPITPPPVYGAPPTRVDLNPATLAPWTGFGLQPSTFPARPGVSPRVGVVGKDQSRLPGMGGNGNVGGGMGGGGGGGW